MQAKPETTQLENTPERLSPVRTLAAPVDVFENKDNFLIHADFPGVEQKDVEVRFEKNTLNLQGTFQEGRNGPRLMWARSFVLPGGIDAEKINAELKDGVLKVTLPKQEALKPRQIQVRAA